MIPCGFKHPHPNVLTMPSSFGASSSGRNRHSLVPARVAGTLGEAEEDFFEVQTRHTRDSEVLVYEKALIGDLVVTSP